MICLPVAAKQVSGDRALPAGWNDACVFTRSRDFRNLLATSDNRLTIRAGVGQLTDWTDRVNSVTQVDVDEHLSRALAGNRSGLGHLLEAFRPLLDAIARKELHYPLRKRMSESDLVQDTMLTASAAFSRFQGASAAEFRAWLLRVFESRLTDGMRRHIVAERRRQSRDESGVSARLPDTAPSPGDVVSATEESRRLVDAVADLPVDDRRIVLLRYVRQQSFEVIAHELDLPVATVWRRWGRIVEYLRRRLAK